MTETGNDTSRGTRSQGTGPASRIFARVAGDPGETDAEARNGLRHVGSLAMTKLADGLIDPKLVLSWLLTALGTPAVYAGALVPIREAGALLPQIALAARVQAMRRRKWAWVAGSAVQGAAALSIAAAGFLLDGVAAGLAICAALAVLAVARAAASVSYKDVLGKTVGQSRRGAVTGLAGSVASAGVVIFALLLLSGLLQARLPVLLAIALAGALWLAAAALFSTLEEAVSEDRQPVHLGDFRRIIVEDADLRLFILVRGLLVATALVPPYLVVLAGRDGAPELQRLGGLVAASALASLLSSYVWGRFSDRSSRRVLAATGVIGALAMAAALGLTAAGLMATIWAGPAVLFVVMVAYHGVRQARSIYLVDMSPDDVRAPYAAVANTAIGAVLLLAGVFGGALALVSPEVAVTGFAVMAAAGGALALRLPEVEAEG